MVPGAFPNGVAAAKMPQSPYDCLHNGPSGIRLVDRRFMQQLNVTKNSRIVLSLLISLCSAAGAVLLLAWLTDKVLAQETASLDEHLRLAIHAHAAPTLTALMTWITNLGSTIS